MPSSKGGVCWLCSAVLDLTQERKTSLQRRSFCGNKTPTDMVLLLVSWSCMKFSLINGTHLLMMFFIFIPFFFVCLFFSNGPLLLCLQICGHEVTHAGAEDRVIELKGHMELRRGSYPGPRTARVTMTIPWHSQKPFIMRKRRLREANDLPRVELQSVVLGL
uniref:Uncharacterized protein n=1 Tax=Rousettus aegyptiacus TaxID=9407 RepID=A0A7J8INE6_ROUAE|nr:hypothetical protein HJG63_010800 [Rousettus aegyptiacus]